MDIVISQCPHVQLLFLFLTRQTYVQVYSYCESKRVSGLSLCLFINICQQMAGSGQYSKVTRLSFLTLQHDLWYLGG